MTTKPMPKIRPGLARWQQLVLVITPMAATAALLVGMILSPPRSVEATAPPPTVTFTPTPEPKKTPEPVQEDLLTDAGKKSDRPEPEKRKDRRTPPVEDEQPGKDDEAPSPPDKPAPTPTETPDPECDPGFCGDERDAP